MDSSLRCLTSGCSTPAFDKPAGVGPSRGHLDCLSSHHRHRHCRRHSCQFRPPFPSPRPHPTPLPSPEILPASSPPQALPSPPAAGDEISTRSNQLCTPAMVWFCRARIASSWRRHSGHGPQSSLPYCRSVHSLGEVARPLGQISLDSLGSGFAWSDSLAHLKWWM